LWAIYSINRYTDDQPLATDKIFRFEVTSQDDVLRNRPTNRPSNAIHYFIPGRNELISKFAQNDLSDGWSPRAPLYIHHGTRDDLVYYHFNAETTVNNLNKLGGDVELVKYVGHDHESLDKLYLLNMLEAFVQY
jgi:acetyl esterase/lipase